MRAIIAAIDRFPAASYAERSTNEQRTLGRVHGSAPTGQVQLRGRGSSDHPGLPRDPAIVGRGATDHGPLEVGHIGDPRRPSPARDRTSGAHRGRRERRPRPHECEEGSDRIVLALFRELPENLSICDEIGGMELRDGEAAFCDFPEA
jgi:hypothetical protein